MHQKLFVTCIWADFSFGLRGAVLAFVAHGIIGAGHARPCPRFAAGSRERWRRSSASSPQGDRAVRQASASPSASFRFAVTCDTLAVRLTFPLVGRVEDLHLQVGAPCRAHQKKRGTLGCPSAYTNAFTAALLETIHVGNADHIHRVIRRRLVCRQQRRTCRMQNVLYWKLYL